MAAARCTLGCCRGKSDSQTHSAWHSKRCWMPGKDHWFLASTQNTLSRAVEEPGLLSSLVPLLLLLWLLVPLSLWSWVVEAVEASQYTLLFRQGMWEPQTHLVCQSKRLLVHGKGHCCQQSNQCIQQ